MELATRIRWENAYRIIEPQIDAEGVHVYPFRPDFPVEVRFLSFGHAGGIRLNRHEYFELMYLYSGEILYQVQDQYLRMKQGDLFIIGSTLMHRVCKYPRGPAKAAVLYFLPDLIRSADPTGDDVEYLMPFLAQDAGFPHIIPAATGLPAQVFDLMKRTCSELPATSHRARLSAKTYLKMILVLLVNYFSEFRGGTAAFLRRQQDLARLRPLFDMVERRFPNNITIEDAASALNMGKSTFMRFFKRVTGEPFLVYLNQFRVAKAQALLAKTDKPLAEISNEVGFCDQSYFGLVFRRVAHMTPREYKRWCLDAKETSLDSRESS